MWRGGIGMWGRWEVWGECNQWSTVWNKETRLQNITTLDNTLGVFCKKI